jgi:hypothetical protein
MLTYTELGALERELSATRVLSVYLNGEATDPAQRRNWRTELENGLSRARESCRGAPHIEREAFARSVEHLQAALAPVTGAIGAPGWLAFVTATGVRHAESLPVAVATSVSWGDGPRVAPYALALPQHRPVAIAVVDTRQARLFVFRDGALATNEVLHVAEAGEAPTRARGGHPGSEGFHAGVRGVTGADESDRTQRAALRRHASLVAEHLSSLAERDGLLLIGGTPHAAEAVLDALSPRLRRHASTPESLGFSATPAEIVAVARSAASAARQADQLALVGALVREATPDGWGRVGLEGVRDAIENGRARQLVLSRRFLESHPDESEAVVRSALTHRATIDVVDGPAGERLEEGGGVAARLRFAQRGVGVPTAAG